MWRRLRLRRQHWRRCREGRHEWVVWVDDDGQRTASCLWCPATEVLAE